MTTISYKSLLLILFVFVNLSVAANEKNPPKQKLSPAEERKFDYFFYEGLKLKHAGKLDSSLEMFRHCLEIDSTSSAALYELSTYYILFDQPEKAASLMKRAVAYSPNNHEYRNSLASLLFNLENFGEAAEEYVILADVYPDRPELNFYLAESYSRMGETGKAINTFNALENVIGMSEALSMEKYRLFMSLQQQDSAMNEIVKLADKFPAESRYPIILGDLYLRQDDNVQALKYFRKAFEIDPESPYYPVSMANYYEKIGHRDSAKLQINAALINNRLDLNTKLRIFSQYILQNYKQDVDGAVALFQTLIEQHPEEARLKLMYGEFLNELKRFDEARFQIQLVTESEPENIEAWQQLVQLAFQMDDIDEAIRVCIKCLDIFPKEMMFPYFLGTAYYQKKDFQSAVTTFETAIPLIPAGNFPLLSNFYSLIGDAYFKLKEIDKSFNAYEQALKYNDKNTMALNNYAYYLSLLNKELSKAERMSAICMKLEPNNPSYIDTYAWIFFKQRNLGLARVYIEQAISKDKSNNAELADHYGDILYFLGEKEKALEQWEKAWELGKKHETIKRKIAEKTYFEATIDELFSEMDENE